MCLSINRAHSTRTKPFIPTVDECDNINSVLCVSRKNSVVRTHGCSVSGYYRVSYAARDDLCYSIIILDQPLSISDDFSMNLVCEGSQMLTIDNIESHIIYRQLANATNLGTHDRCLFGLLYAGVVIKYSDWVRFDNDVIDSIKFTNWDKSVDFSTVYMRENNYLTVNSEGKWRWEEIATCIICAMNDPLQYFGLNLVFDITKSELTLSANFDLWNLWRENDSDRGFLCFALIANNYIDNITVIRNSESNNFLLTNVGAGKYWCSGHRDIVIGLDQTEQVYAFGMVFAFHVDYDCNIEPECGNGVPFTNEFTEFLMPLINEDLVKVEELISLEYTDYSVTHLTMIFHVMLSMKDEILHENEFNEIGLSEDQLNTYYALKYLRQIQPGGSGGNVRFSILSIDSREFCLPDTITSPEVLNWKAVKFGETVELFESCLKFSRTCSRTGSYGAVWEEYVLEYGCNNQSEISRSLINLLDSFRSSNQTPEVISNLSTSLHNVSLNEADVFVVSTIFEKISHFLLSDQVCLSSCDLKNVFDIFNSLMTIPQDVAIASVHLNSTNSLLASFDEILIHYTLTLTNNESFSDGIAQINASLVANYILDPMVSGFSGIALLGNNGRDDKDFLSYSVRYLQPDQSIEDLLQDENMTLASFVPEALLVDIINPKIIFTLFFNDTLFQSHKNHEINSDGSVISLTILNSESQLSSSIPFLFKPNTFLFHHDEYRAAQFCGYWNFTSENGWDRFGCKLNESALQISDTILCECKHLTHFGNLVNREVFFSEIDEKVLNLITLTGCTLSLIGIIGIFLTAIVFRSWRSKSSSKFLLQLSAAIALQMILLIFINSDDHLLVRISKNFYACIATGALIHYSILVMFLWMLIIAYLQFIRYVIVFNQIGTANFLLKSSIFGWGMPVLPVFIVAAVNPMSYIPTSNVKFCYPNGNSFLYGLLIPIILIVVANVFVFLAVVISLVKSSSKSAACKVNDKNDATWSQLRLSVFLFFVLGLSWIFGFLSDRSIWFSYLFCLTATLQGFVLFFYFVILDPVARKLWKQFFMKLCGYKVQ